MVSNLLQRQQSAKCQDTSGVLQSENFRMPISPLQSALIPQMGIVAHLDRLKQKRNALLEGDVRDRFEKLVRY